MTTIARILKLSVALLSVGIPVSAGELRESTGPVREGEYIVVLRQRMETPLLAGATRTSAQPLLPAAVRTLRHPSASASAHPFRSRYLHVVGATLADARELAARPDVLKVIPNVLGSTSGLRLNSPEPLATGLDRIDQRGPNVLGAGKGYYTDSWTGRGVDVFLLDDSVRTTHVDFASNPSWSRTVQNEFDATLGACPTYETSHGTQMASMIAGRVGGVARDANIRAIDITCSGNTIELDDALRAIEYVYYNGSSQIAIVNMSWEFSSPAAIEAINPLLSEVYWETSNLIFVAAAGNGATLASSVTPASSDVVLAVGNISTSSTSDLWEVTSNHGPKVGLLAPGAGIRAADASSNTSYSSYGNGTSASAAHVSGALARLKEKYAWYGGGAAEYHDLLVANASSASVGGLPANTTNKVLFTDFEAPPQDRVNGLQSTGYDNIRRVVTIGAAGDSLVGGEYQRQEVYYPCTRGVGSLGFVERRSVTGTAVWSRTLGWSCSENAVVGVGADEAGDAYAVVQTSYSELSQNYFTVYKLSGATGATVWSSSLGSSNTYAADLAVFEQGSVVFVVGHTYDVIEGLPVLGGWDVFVVGYSSSTGSTSFMQSVGSKSDDFATSVTANAGSGYVGGVTYGLLPAATSLTGAAVSSSYGGVDGFVVRVSLKGAIQKTLQFGTAGTESGVALGRWASPVFMAATTTGSMAASSSGPGGGSDVVVAKLDINTLVASWVRQLGSAANEVSPAIATVRASEDVWVVGSTYGSWFGTNPGGSDAFVAKISVNGTFHWGEQSSGLWDDGSSCIAIPSVTTTAELVKLYVGGTTTSNWPMGTLSGGSDGFLRTLRGL